jgi:hypothetical protein
LWQQRDPDRGSITDPSTLRDYTFVGLDPVNHDEIGGGSELAMSVSAIQDLALAFGLVVSYYYALMIKAALVIASINLTTLLIALAVIVLVALTVAGIIWAWKQYQAKKAQTSAAVDGTSALQLDPEPDEESGSSGGNDNNENDQNPKPAPLPDSQPQCEKSQAEKCAEAMYKHMTIEDPENPDERTPRAGHEIKPPGGKSIQQFLTLLAQGGTVRGMRVGYGNGGTTILHDRDVILFRPGHEDCGTAVHKATKKAAEDYWKDKIDDFMKPSDYTIPGEYVGSGIPPLHRD